MSGEATFNKKPHNWACEADLPWTIIDNIHIKGLKELLTPVLLLQAVFAGDLFRNANILEISFMNLALIRVGEPSILQHITEAKYGNRLLLTLEKKELVKAHVLNGFLYNHFEVFSNLQKMKIYLARERINRLSISKEEGNFSDMFTK
ncbi:hypothetical protein ACJX0J_039450 [Zea mays]